MKCRLQIGYRLQTDNKIISVKNTINFRFLTYGNVTQSPFRDEQNPWLSLVRFASFHLMRPFLNDRSKKLDKKRLGFMYFVA